MSKKKNDQRTDGRTDGWANYGKLVQMNVDLRRLIDKVFGKTRTSVELSRVFHLSIVFINFDSFRSDFQVMMLANELTKQTHG